MAISETLKKPITGEKLIEMGDIGRGGLVKREANFMNPPGGRPGYSP